MGWEYREEESSWMLPKTVEELGIEESDMKGRSLLPSLGLGFDEETNLKEIRLEECIGMISITKVGGKLDSFSHLMELEISWCGDMKVIFSFTEHPPYLPNLKYIKVKNCKEVEEIFQSNERASQCVSPTQSNPIILSLPNLKTLWVKDCKEVEEIFQINKTNPALPNLEELRLIKLPKLKRVFPFTEQLRQLPNFKELFVLNCEEVEEIFQIYNPNLGLPNLSSLYLENLPKLKWVFNPFTFTEQLRQLPDLEKLRVEDCEEVEEIFRICNPDPRRRYQIWMSLNNLPKLKWVFPFTEHPLHLVQLEGITVLNCSMLRSICRGLILFPLACVRQIRVENSPKLKVFRTGMGIIIVDSKSTIKCISNNNQFWETLQQDYPHKASLLSHFINQGMELWQGLDDDNDDGGVDGDGAEDDGGGDGDGTEGDGGVLVLDDGKTTWGASLSLLPY